MVKSWAEKKSEMNGEDIRKNKKKEKRKMETREIYENLVKKLEENENVVKTCRQEVTELRAQLESAEAKLKVVEGNIEAYRMAKEALEMGDFGMEIQENKKETVEKKEEDKDDKQLVWKHKSAFVLQIDRFGKQMGKYRTQKCCAREIGWDQSALSKFMRLSMDQQDARKGYHFVWEH